MIERRTAPRVAVRLLVQHQADVGESFDIDYATDLSRNGLFIATQKALVPDTTLHVQFAPKRDSRLVSAFCRVTRVTKTGVGAEFVGLDAEAQHLIDSAIAANGGRLELARL